jgi:hypothetical protein
MKKLFYAFAALAVVASCAKVAEVENNVEPKDEKNLVRLTIRTQAPQTKTYIEQVGSTNKYQPSWNEGDKLALFFDSTKSAKDAELENYGDDGDPAEFVGDVSVSTGDHTIYAFYPATTVFKKGSTDQKVELQVATVQRPAANTFDPSADIAVAKAYSINVTGNSVDIADMVFARLLSTIKVTVTESNGDIDPAETINAISITGEANLTGALVWDFVSEDATAASDNATVTADLAANPIAFGTPIYLLVNPATLAAGSELTVTVSTSAHEVTKTINNLPKDFVFPLGGISELRINLDGDASVAVAPPVSEPTSGWSLVKKLHWLRPGDEVAIVAAAHAVAMSTTQNSNNRGTVDVTVSDDIMTINNTVQRFTLENGTVANTYSFKSINGAQTNNYIYAASSSNNYMRSKAAKDDNASFSIVIDDSGVATVVASGSNTHSFMRYNTSGMFSCYNKESSIKEEVRLFKLYASYSVPALDTPTNLDAVDVDGDVLVTWDAVSDADSYTVSCGETVQTGVTDTDYTFLGVVPGTYTVTVKAISNDHSVKLDSDVATTSVTVVDSGSGSDPDLSGDYLIGSYSSDVWELMTSDNTADYYGHETTSVSTAFASLNSSEFVSAGYNTNDYLWKVEKNGTGYSIKSYKTNNYVALTTDGNKAYTASALDGDNTRFSISISEGIATIQSASFSSRCLKYNASSPRFAFYTSAQTSISLIPCAYDNRTAVTLSFADDLLAYSTNDFATCTGQVVSASPNVAAITNNITYTLTGDAIGTVNATSGAVSLNGTTGAATITASFPGNSDYLPAQKSYSITVSTAGGGSTTPDDNSSNFTGNITLSTAGGTSASDCVIAISGTDYNGIKAGTGKIAGAVKITVPAGTKFLHLHVAGWKGENVTLTVTPSGYSSNIALTSDDGISNNSPFTFSGNASSGDFYKVIEFTNPLASDTILTFTATSGKRFVVWGVTSQE